MRIVPDRETLTIEFKSDLKKLHDNDLVDAVIGMANTEGGVIFLGVEDNGQITGVHRQHEDEIGVAALIANRTVPSVAVRAELVSEGEYNILKIEVPISKTVVAAADGKILRRRLKIDGTPENIPMYPYEISTRLSELGLLDFSAQIINDAVQEDLDSSERQRLRNIIKMRKGDKSLLELTDEELDKALRLVKEENGIIRPTVTGMLLIGKEERLQELMPTAKAGFQVLEGTSVRVNEQFGKPLLATFEIIENYMKAWNPEREMENGLFRIPIPEFSEAAFREGLVNAFCHRDYSVLQMVRLVVEDEGLSISSPGGFIEGVNLNNLLTVEPHGRNQTLADALKRIGLAERTGRGIDRIYEGSIIYGRPIPDYSESTGTYVKLFIPRAEPDLQFANMISNAEKRMGRKLSISSLLILSILQMGYKSTVSELAENIHVSTARTKVNVDMLLEWGLLETSANRNGKTRVMSYILSEMEYKKHSSPSGNARKIVIGKPEYEKQVLKLAKKNGYVTREGVSRLLGVTDSQAYRVLKKLADKEKIVLVGKGRTSRYVLNN